jgi:hypothetical protein
LPSPLAIESEHVATRRPRWCPDFVEPHPQRALERAPFTDPEQASQVVLQPPARLAEHEDVPAVEDVHDEVHRVHGQSFGRLKQLDPWFVAKPGGDPPLRLTEEP